MTKGHGEADGDRTPEGLVDGEPLARAEVGRWVEAVAGLLPSGPAQPPAMTVAATTTTAQTSSLGCPVCLMASMVSRQ